TWYAALPPSALRIAHRSPRPLVVGRKVPDQRQADSGEIRDDEIYASISNEQPQRRHCDSLPDQGDQIEAGKPPERHASPPEGPVVVPQEVMGDGGLRGER